MSKLNIKDALESNPDVYVGKEINRNFLPHMYKEGSYFVYFLVAPKRKLFTLNELQQFMDGLLPLEPSSAKPFAEDNCNLRVGTLYFQEKIGEERVITKEINGKPVTIERIMEITDEELKNTNGFKDGKRTIKIDKKYKGNLQGCITKSDVNDYLKTILVRVYPDKASAKNRLEKGLVNLDTLRYTIDHY